MLATAALTTFLLSASPPSKAALVFMQVESPTEKDATPLLEESLRHAFSSRLAIITCKEAIQDETALKKVLEGRDIKSSADAPKKVSLLTNFSKYDCEIPEDGALWAAWLTAYVDARNGRREVSLRMRNLRDKESTPTFASLAEPANAHLSWSELVEHCVRRYFEEEELAEIQITPTARLRMRDPLALQARLSVSSQETEARDLGLHWKLYQCSESAGCDRFRAAVEEYVNCRRSNRARSSADPSLTPLCIDPQEAYDRLAVQALADHALPWVHWTEAPAPTLAVDLPGEYLLVASSRGALAGAERLTVEPPENILSGFAGTAWRPQLVDLFGMVGFHRVLVQFPDGIELALGGDWSFRLGRERSPPPPFGARGMLAPSLIARRYITAEFCMEAWGSPAGLLYEFNDPGGYSLFLGALVGIAAVYHPSWTPGFTIRLATMGVFKTLEPGHSEVYGPLLGITLER